MIEFLIKPRTVWHPLVIAGRVYAWVVIVLIGAAMFFVTLALLAAITA